MNIKRKIMITMIAAGILTLWVTQEANAQFVSGSTGADGALNITTNTNLPLPPSGIFNFTTVNIATGTTLTFTRSGANTPVRILATDNVMIDGTISVDGQPGGDGQIGQVSQPGGTGGPGGFNGGQGGYGGVQRVSGSYGLGSGGGEAWGLGHSGNGGHYNCAVIFCLGGSGGGGGTSGYSTQNVPTGSSGGSGGGGGGEILIASTKTITINGSVRSEGGKGGNSVDASLPGGGGSGGFIRIIATKILGTGFLSARGGAGGTGPVTTGTVQGDNGVVSLEALIFTFTGTSTTGYRFSSPVAAIPPNLPSLRISSIGGQTVPANARGTPQTIDVTLPPTIVNPVPVTVSATNIPVETYVNITVTSASGGGRAEEWYKALSGTLNDSSATGSLNMPSGVSIVEAYTPNAFTVTASLAPHLPLIGGEPVEQIKVGSVLGGGDTLALVTKSGREVPARWIAGELVPIYEE